MYVFTLISYINSNVEEIAEMGKEDGIQKPFHLIKLV